MNAVGKSLRNAPGKVALDHVAELSHLFVQRMLYLLASPPKALTVSHATTCWALKLWKPPTGPLVSVIWAFKSLLHLRRATWNIHEYFCHLRRVKEIEAVPETKASLKLSVVFARRACLQLRKAGVAKAGECFSFLYQYESPFWSLVVLYNAYYPVWRIFPSFQSFQARNKAG